MIDYAYLRHAHITFALLSLTGFILRAWWGWRGSSLLQRRSARILPHVNDTLLLIAGIWMAVVSAQYPWTQPWLGAKLAALMLYILLGTLALKRAKSRSARFVAFIGAIATFAYILAAAHLRTPWPLAFS